MSINAQNVSTLLSKIATLQQTFEKLNSLEKQNTNLIQINLLRLLCVAQISDIRQNYIIELQSDLNEIFNQILQNINFYLNKNIKESPKINDKLNICCIIKQRRPERIRKGISVPEVAASRCENECAKHSTMCSFHLKAKRSSTAKSEACKRRFRDKRTQKFVRVDNVAEEVQLSPESSDEEDTDDEEEQPKKKAKK